MENMDFWTAVSTFLGGPALFIWYYRMKAAHVKAERVSLDVEESILKLEKELSKLRSQL